MITWMAEKKYLFADGTWDIKAADMADGFIGPLFPLVVKLRHSIESQSNADIQLAHVKAIEQRLLHLFGWIENVECVWRNNLELETDKANTEIERLTKVIEQLQAPPSQPREVHRLNDPGVRQDVWRLTGGKCAYCDVPIQDGAGLEPTSMCVEHVVPKSMGGPDHLTNYVPACRSCNNSKSDRHVLTLVRKLQRRQETVIVSTQVMPERDGEEAA